MADVLSQSQIDALLKSMSADAPAQEKKTESVQPLSPEEKNYIKYDFFSPSFKRSPDRAWSNRYDYNTGHGLWNPERTYQLLQRY